MFLFKDSRNVLKMKVSVTLRQQLLCSCAVLDVVEMVCSPYSCVSRPFSRGEVKGKAKVVPVL
jgi:hypothetical protein